MGFSLNLPTIARKTSNGIPRYAGNDVFILAGQGELVPALVWDTATGRWRPDVRTDSSGDQQWEVTVYRPRAESAFSCIELWANRLDRSSHWRVLTRDNVLWLYGVTASAQIYDPRHPGQVFQWYAEESLDSVGNKIRYCYKPEDGAGLPPEIYEQGRDHQANRYIASVEYGNYVTDGTEHFSGRIVFDYGEYSVAAPGRLPGEWSVRPDPFSSYRSGFEIRTLRRCQAVLVYHCFHDQFDAEPYLVRALEFEYEQAGRPGLSFVRRVSETGFRRQADGGYQRAPYPPLLLAYSPFEPGGRHYQQLTVEPDGAFPSYLGPGQYLLTDLDGQGLPGVLYSGAAGPLYWPPLGGGRYAGPVSPVGFPLESDLSRPGVALTSLQGDGRKDLIVNTPGRSGYYGCDGTLRWQPFRPFPAVPPALAQAELVDMTGAGRADIALLEREKVSTWPSRGPGGYGPPEQAPSHPGFPVSKRPDAREFLGFADMFGDGLSHRVRISDGQVECWPNLGYGAFGPKVTMGNAPRFAGGLDTGRLFLIDIDGSGPADLVYVQPDRVQVFFSQSGNGFSGPLEVSLPVPYDQLSQISFADVYGNGTACLILTQLTPAAVHYVYDFCGNAKPYLLTSLVNQLGSSVRVSYTTSVRQCLEDKRQGRTWATRLFFPVQVVERVEHSDETTGTRYITRYRHHDGYYDPEERQFQGFGFVESWDTEEYSDLSAAGTSVAADRYVPPVYTKAWFHTGTLLEQGVISRQYDREYWHGDQRAPRLPETRLDPAAGKEDARTLRQAYTALAGSLLRREVYGQDKSPLAPEPYSVLEGRFEVRLIQPRDGQRFAAFLVYPIETLSCEYDRDPDDPRVTHEIALVVDEYGNPRRSCQVGYPRRAPACPEQAELHVTVSEAGYSVPGPGRWIGVQVEGRNYEINGVPAPPGCFSLAEVRALTDDALRDPLAFGQPFTPGLLQARLSSWTRTRYWDESLLAPLPLGQLGRRGLVHHTEEACVTPELVAELFVGKGDADELMRGCGYWLNDGYWWNRGLIQHYHADPAAFYLPYRIDGRFDDVDPDGPLNPATVMTYDAYNLLPTTVTRYLRGNGAEPGALTLRVSADYDYHVLVPWRVTDVNGNVTEVAIDPLGVVIVSTLYGVKNGVPVGDAPLNEYQRQPDPTFGEVIGDPARYVQRASSFYFYDLFAWTARRQPQPMVGIRRQDYAYGAAVGERGEGQGSEPAGVQIGVTYTDGFGRIIANKLKTAPGRDLAERWVTSGRVTYDNKALVTERYLPYFSPSPAYEREPGASLPPPAVYHYDPVGRLVRTDTPKGFFSKVTFSPWTVRAYDEDDTVRESAFFRQFPEHPVTPAEQAERAALDMAAGFYNTPSAAVLDTSGRVVRSLADNLGGVTPADLAPIVDGSGRTPQQVWDELAGYGYLAVELAGTGWVTERLRPYDRAFQTLFTSQFGSLAAPLLNLLKEGCLTTLQVLDAGGNVISMIDPRLLYSNATAGTDYRNVATAYDMTGNVLVTRSADAGTRWALSDVLGRPARAWDGRSVPTVRDYDRVGRLVRVLSGDQPVLSELLRYGEDTADPADRNLIGRVYQHYDQAGLVTNDAYTLTGLVVTTTRQVRADYESAADWTPAAMAAIARQPGYATSFSHDALGRVLSQTAPNGVTATSSFNLAGQLERSAVTIPDGTTPVIEAIDYNANGQRTSIRYGNGTATSNEYEDTTLRLRAITTTGPDRVLQDIRYTFDPVGNVTRAENRSLDAAFCYRQPVNPAADYAYDALYQLVSATGRELPREDRFLPFCPPQPPPEHLTDYTEHYGYDDGGNLISVEHVGTGHRTSRFDVAPDSNRLAGEPYDANGNLTALGDLRQLDWDIGNTLVRVILPGDGGTEYYQYDAGGGRVLKAGGGRETVYVGSYQVSAGRESVSVMDDHTRVCLVEHDAGAWNFRYQLNDSVCSVGWEVDGQGLPLSYQEFLPYGGSAFMAAATPAQAADKEFRYAGKELDAGTDLYYYGARYYSPAYGRWLSPDPMGPAGLGATAGLNPYAFVEGNPVSKTDTTGGVGFWVMWGVSALGALTTLAVGAIGGYYFGHGRGAASGVFVGVIAGLTGTGVTAAAAYYAGAPTHFISAMAAHSVLAAVEGALVGGVSGELAMQAVTRRWESRNTLAAVVGTMTSGLLGAAVGYRSPLGAGGSFQPTALIGVATGIGSSILASGSVLAFISQDDVPVIPSPLHDTTRIRPAENFLNAQRVPVRRDRMLLVFAPQHIAEQRFGNSLFVTNADAVFRKDPSRSEGPRNREKYHAVIAHGAVGFVMVPTLWGQFMQPLDIRKFAQYVLARLPNDGRPIKFISCFGASWGITSANAQILADITRRKVIAFNGKQDENFTGPWKKFYPR